MLLKPHDSERSILNHMKIEVILLDSFIILTCLHGLTYGNPIEEGYIGSEQCMVCHRGLHPEIVKGWQTKQRDFEKTPSTYSLFSHDNIHQPTGNHNDFARFLSRQVTLDGVIGQCQLACLFIRDIDRHR